MAGRLVSVSGRRIDEVSRFTTDEQAAADQASASSTATTSSGAGIASIEDRWDRTLSR